MVPENFYKTSVLRKQRLLTDRIDNLMIIDELFLPIIVEKGTESKESAQVLRKLDLWFLILAFSYGESYLMIHPRF